MAKSTPPKLPRPVILVGSVLLVGHWLALGIHTLAAPSGPWPTPLGPGTAEPPYFVSKPTLQGTRQGLDPLISKIYLQPLRLTHNYHFQSNQLELPGVYFEVVLKGEDGQEIKSLTFPDKKANPWVRHRQALLAQALADDNVLRPRGSDVIYPEGQAIPTYTVWEPEAPNDFKHFKLAVIQENHIPRDRMVERPSEWARLLARSFVRYLCREHGAASGELIRHSRGAIGPHWLFAPEIPKDVFDERICKFGEK